MKDHLSFKTIFHGPWVVKTQVLLYMFINTEEQKKATRPVMRPSDVKRQSKRNFMRIMFSMILLETAVSLAVGD